MLELNDFYNDGFGWVCRQCKSELKPEAKDGPTRLLREGEGESRMSQQARAKWADPAMRVLECPRCGITELADRR